MTAMGFGQSGHPKHHPPASTRRFQTSNAQCRAGLCLKGMGGHWGQSQGGRRAVTGDVQAVEGGGFWRLGMRLGAGFGVWECLWGRVSAVGRGEGGTPPPLQAIPWCRGLAAIETVLRVGAPQCCAVTNRHRDRPRSPNIDGLTISSRCRQVSANNRHQ